MANHFNLGDVQETALIPLSNRASETLRRHPRVRDEKAVQIIRELGADLSKYDKTVTHECVIARTILFDQTVREYIKKYPNAICLNIGCGLDDRFSRVDNERIQWFDIDLPDSIQVRRKIFEESVRRRMLAANILDPEWMKNIPTDMIAVDGENDEITEDTKQKTQPVIVIAEGLLMYFSKDENQRILQLLADGFPKGIFIVELMRPSMMDEKKHETVRKTNASSAGERNPERNSKHWNHGCTWSVSTASLSR